MCVGDVEVPAGVCVFLIWKCQLGCLCWLSGSASWGVCVGDVEVPAGVCVLVMWKCQLGCVCVGDVEVPAGVCVLACGAGTAAWCIDTTAWMIYHKIQGSSAQLSSSSLLFAVKFFSCPPLPHGTDRNECTLCNKKLKQI